MTEKPYFQDDDVVIYHGDCRDILPTLEPVDLVLTDPPYGIGHRTNYSSNGRSTIGKQHDYPPVVGDDKPFDPNFVLQLGKPTVLFGANYYADKLPPTGGWIVWDKMRPHELDQATAELAWTNFVKGVRVFRFLWNGALRDGLTTEPPLEHPTQKPVALWRWVLALKWIPEGIILDPFMGSGTTLRAAKDMGRKAIGIEIEERYCEIAAKRMSQSVMVLV